MKNLITICFVFNFRFIDIKKKEKVFRDKDFCRILFQTNLTNFFSVFLYIIKLISVFQFNQKQGSSIVCLLTTVILETNFRICEITHLENKIDFSKFFLENFLEQKLMSHIYHLRTLPHLNTLPINIERLHTCHQ